MNSETIIQTLQTLANPDIAEHSQRFFKTGKGEYGEGDKFLGIRVPVLRKHVAQFKKTPLEEVEKVLHSPFHEARLFALLLLVAKFQKGDNAEKEAIYSLYMANTRYINNWDLIDSSAPYIVGPYLFERDKDILFTFACSENLWERRIAIMATFCFLRNDHFEATFEIADILLNDPEGLIHNAVGWMLREVGNRDGEAERAFLNPRYNRMPRTMLRYAIEKFPEAERKKYLRGDI